MSSLTARIQLWLARLNNADGVIVWDYRDASDSGGSKLARMQAGLRGMDRRLRNFKSSVNGIYLTINSPIAIGPI